MITPKVLHLSFDYAENYSEDNIGKSTTVISDFIKSTSEFSDNYVINLKRTVNPFKQLTSQITVNHFHINSLGFPFGIFLKYSMLRIYKKILRLSKHNSFQLDKMDIIHCHKLTFEGIPGYYLAQRKNKNLFVSIRQTDFFVLEYRRDLIPLMKEILQFSSKVFYIAPYMKLKLLNIFGEKFYNEVLLQKLVFLPNKIEMKNFSFNDYNHSGNFLTISWLHKHIVKRKNIFNLFKAIKQINDDSFKLDLIGSGDYLDSVKKWAKNLGIEHQVNFLGFKKNDELEPFLVNSKGFILPSHSESFGVVYAEALVTGTPILYTLGTGFDGLFENVGPKVNSNSVDSIAQGIKDLIKRNEFYRQNIKKLNEHGAFNIFTKEYSYLTYKESIKSVLAQ